MLLRALHLSYQLMLQNDIILILQKRKLELREVALFDQAHIARKLQGPI